MEAFQQPIEPTSVSGYFRGFEEENGQYEIGQVDPTDSNNIPRRSFRAFNKHSFVSPKNRSTTPRRDLGNSRQQRHTLPIDLGR